MRDGWWGGGGDWDKRNEKRKEKGKKSNYENTTNCHNVLLLVQFVADKGEKGARRMVVWFEGWNLMYN